MNIRVHVERMVLDGLPMNAHLGASVQEAVQTELCRLLGQRALPGSLRHASVATCARADTIDLPNRMGVREVGRQIALSIYQGIIQCQSSP